MLQIGGGRPCLDAATQQIQRPLQRLALQPVGGGQHDLLDLGPGGGGALAQHLDARRHLAPAVQPEPGGQNLALDDGAGNLLSALIQTRQEDHADGQRTGARLMARIADLGVEEGARQADQYARAVAGLAVSIDRAPMPDGLQRLEGQIDDHAARSPVDGGDQSDTAGIALRARVIGMGVDQALSVGLILDGVEGHAATLWRLVSQASISAAAS